MNPKQSVVGKGDFTEIAAFMRESGEALANSLGITLSTRALDLGCGDGTTAVCNLQGVDDHSFDLTHWNASTVQP